MASHAPDFARASILPLSAVLGAIPSYPRPVIERLVANLIDHLDEQDGDPDVEITGVEWTYRAFPCVPYADDDDEDGHDAERDDAGV